MKLKLGNILKRVGISSKKVRNWVSSRFKLTGNICLAASTERFAAAELYGHWSNGRLNGPPQLALFGKISASGSIAVASGKARISAAIYGGICTPFYDANRAYMGSYSHASFSVKAWVQLKALGFTVFSDTVYYPSRKKTTVKVNGRSVKWGNVGANVVKLASKNRFGGRDRFETALMDAC